MSNEESTPISSLQNQNENQDINDIINKIEKDNELPKTTPQPVKKEQSQEIEEQEEEYEYSIFDVIYNEVSYPILVAVIYIILSFTKLDDLMCMYIKFICNDTGEMNMFGVFLKSILAGLLFYIFGKYVV